MRFSKSTQIIGYLFLLPVMCLFTLFFFIPMIEAISLSLFQWDGVSEKVFVGLRNYTNLLTDRTFLQPIWNNIIIMLASLFIQLPIALLLAVLLSIGFRGNKFFRTIYFMPSIISTVIVGMIWSFAFNPYYGLVNHLFELMNLSPFIQDWLGDEKIALGTVIFVNVWQWVGYIMIILLAAISSIPDEVNEAATIDGTNALQRLFQITIPMIKGTINVCALLVITGSLKMFDLIFILTGGGPNGSTEVMSTTMWRLSFISGRFGAGNAIAVLILILSVGFTLAFNLITDGKKRNMRTDL